jgi:hypothetical protein
MAKTSAKVAVDVGLNVVIVIGITGFATFVEWFAPTFFVRVVVSGDAKTAQERDYSHTGSDVIISIELCKKGETASLSPNKKERKKKRALYLCLSIFICCPLLHLSFQCLLHYLIHLFFIITLCCFIPFIFVCVGI